jgi:hypothetical protein
VGLLLISSCESGFKSSYNYLISSPIILTQQQLTTKYYSAETVPSCTLLLSPTQVDRKCYMSKSESQSSELETLHHRFLDNIRKLEKNGGEYLKQSDDKNAIYEEAFCTLDVLNSCALENVIRKNNSPILASKIMFAVSGYEMEFDETASLYPANYNPKNFNDFSLVINNKLNSKKAFTGSE